MGALQVTKKPLEARGEATSVIIIFLFWDDCSAYCATYNNNFILEHSFRQIIPGSTREATLWFTLAVRPFSALFNIGSSIFYINAFLNSEASNSYGDRFFKKIIRGRLTPPFQEKSPSKKKIFQPKFVFVYLSLKQK